MAKRIGLALLLVATQAGAWAQDAELASRLRAMVSKLPRGAQAGILVQGVSGDILFEHQADLLLKPGSVLKLFTTATALERLGPQFSFETRAYFSGDEFIVIGGGDPGLGDERLARAIGQPPAYVFDTWCDILAQRGVKRIETIVLDDSIFDQELLHPDWPAAQNLSWYQAPIAGLNFNDNCVDVGVRPGRGGPVVESMPPLPANLLLNRLASGRRHNPRVSRRPDSDVFELSGSVAKSDELGPITVRRPALVFGSALTTALEARGISCGGRIVRRDYGGAVPAGAQLLHVHATSLRDVLWRCNTFSQNFFAECLLKALAAYRPDGRRSGLAGSWRAGLRVEVATLERLGLDLRDSVLRDGSGLSHENRVTARQLAALVTTMLSHREAREFFDSLAIAGQDGTLRRYNTPVLAGRIHGKTGTLNNVHAIVALLERAADAPLIIVVLANGPGSSGLPRAVCEAVAGEAQ